ncbi:MAG: hypothetical protein CVT95_05420 [Bacteroidetes bacterium HGW-Bacteroidetes-12]|nr:MAG: hypothetical protein CVT95_05420 [Bacteroidetes bacterium HGW-Bacteroidetes-12]
MCLFSCREQTSKNDNELPETNHISDTKTPIVNFSNPSIFMGSSFGSFFQMLHKTGKYNEMLRYTSKKTKEKYSNEQLLAFYTNIQFSYPLKLKAKKEENNIIILLYQTTINATQKTIQIPIIIENDTCRIWFDKLNAEKPFVGI